MVYDNEGNKLNEKEAEKNFDDYWKTIYQKHSNKIDEIWNRHLKSKYIEEYRETSGIVKTEDGVTFPKKLQDHIDSS